MTCYKFDCSHWCKIYLKNKPLQDFLSSLNAVISTKMRALEFITGHVIYNSAYTYKFQLKTTLALLAQNSEDPKLQKEIIHRLRLQF